MEVNIPYEQYAVEAYQRQMELAKLLAAKQANAQGMLGGKPAAQGETYMSGPKGLSGRQGLYNEQAASQAFDALQNMREAEMQDMQMRYELARMRGRK